MAQMYESNVLLMVHGDDFRFNMIEEWHQHHDNFLPLFEEINTSGLAEIRNTKRIVSGLYQVTDAFKA
ncbi:hypothetical protein ANCDUO_01928 [Ancylostoma duodenale]|uniref:Uncharacterized protein n=1 Tax=Ancylostoma duodenale TaxID=51022 RepID=A0A0C2HDW1_9BILA|nr:hypothetical protein ANCDUO_01928 [Ancylostoma duodenale]